MRVSVDTCFPISPQEVMMQFSFWSYVGMIRDISEHMSSCTGKNILVKMP